MPAEAAQERMKKGAPSPPGWAGSDDVERFMALVENGEDTAKPPPPTRRSAGGVVLVRGGLNLRELQRHVHRAGYSSLRYFTARYRLATPAIFGTLVAAFIEDLSRLSTGSGELTGDFQPGPEEPEIKRLAETQLKEFPASWQAKAFTHIQEDQLTDLLRTFNNSRIFHANDRLILFVEIALDQVPAQEWQHAVERLFPQLPPAVILVLSGLPVEVSLPDDPVHFMTIDQPADSGGDERRYSYKIAALHTDRATRDDWIGLGPFATALARFIIHPQTRPPLTIGIHGEWGKGKSSFMEMVDAALVKWTKANAAERAAEHEQLEAEYRQLQESVATAAAAQHEALQQQLGKLDGQRRQLWEEMQKRALAEVVSVKFNAWQFEDAKQIWAGLVSVISRHLEAALPWWSRRLLRVNYTVQKRRTELLVGLLLPVLVIVMIGLLPFLGSSVIDQLGNIFAASGSEQQVGQLLRLLLPGGTGLVLLWLVPWRLYKLVQPLSQRVLSYVQIPSYREHMGFQHQVMEDLQFAYNYLHVRRPECKVVVYIDDLDRCSDDKIMEILQAINLILATSEFFVLVGMDTEMIYRAIRSHYNRTFVDEPIAHDFPENYLRKILQFSFYLPATKPEKRFALVGRLFSARARREFLSLQAAGGQAAGGQAAGGGALEQGWAVALDKISRPIDYQLEEVEDAGTELAAFAQFQEFLEDNPREIKRLVNVHRLVKILLQHDGGAWPRDRQERLVKWLLFCANWSDLIDDVIVAVKKNPDAEDPLLTILDGLEPEEGEDDQLEIFRKFVAHTPVLSAKDIDDQFILAASLTQMLRFSPAPRRDHKQFFGFNPEPQREKSAT